MKSELIYVRSFDILHMDFFPMKIELMVSLTDHFSIGLIFFFSLGQGMV